MPWILNAQSMAQQLILRNGSTLRLGGRKREYVLPQLMSGDIHYKVSRGLVRNLGEDRATIQRQNQLAKSATSSNHQQDRDMVATVSEESSANSSSKSKRSARKNATERKTSKGKKKKSGE